MAYLSIYLIFIFLFFFSSFHQRSVVFELLWFAFVCSLRRWFLIKWKIKSFFSKTPIGQNNRVSWSVRQRWQRRGSLSFQVRNTLSGGQHNLTEISINKLQDAVNKQALALLDPKKSSDDGKQIRRTQSGDCRDGRADIHSYSYL